jgi:hypothetical protein
MKHEVVFDASSGMNCENYVVINDFGNGQKLVKCGCGTIFITRHILECPTCKAENAILESVELLAKFALENDKDLKDIILTLATPLSGFDLSSDEEFPYLAKYLRLYN